MIKQIEQTNEVEKFTAKMAREALKPYKEQKLLEEKRQAIEAIKRASLKKDYVNCISYTKFEDEVIMFLHSLGYDVYINYDVEDNRYVMHISW